MNIREFSKQVGLSSHTLRYYEKIGLLKNIQRSVSGHRVYTNKDKSWIEFVKRLKDTGMPLDEILVYASLRENGTETLKERQQLLEQHREELIRHIEMQQKHLSALDDKIMLYKQGKVA
ncbi:MerR family transcriptional regulator [Vibrio marisflavi]|uniref:HTH-type transcriptional regulator AdhR n=1 Tax=Vibrio marisflavi CECT 7928 TaxID=634439 RepID=A0ABM9A1V8_9VIBR|nr:MerR family transcriptional regulator [Vibrio marisflavi]CAH0537810.1 HTH-type transcriptional regulator AdhR [Vibrio marisflavi CECT 7928]